MDEAYTQIDQMFTNYLLSCIGPNQDENQRRQENFNVLKSLFENYFLKKGYQVRFLYFGSFPLRTYLPESDIDCTLIFENAGKGSYLDLNSDQQRE